MMLNKILIMSLLSCAVYADDTSTSPTSSPAPASQEQTTSLPGGYNTIKVDDKDVVTAANFAVAQMQKGTLTKILAAEVQVVAGKNYKLHFQIKGSNGVEYLYDVVVFVPLPVTQQPMQLTTVQALGMAEN